MPAGSVSSSSTLQIFREGGRSTETEVTTTAELPKPSAAEGGLQFWPEATTTQSKVYGAIGGLRTASFIAATAWCPSVVTGERKGEEEDDDSRASWTTEYDPPYIYIYIYIHLAGVSLGELKLSC